MFTRIRKKEFVEAAEANAPPNARRLLPTNELIIPPFMLVEHTVREFPPANRPRTPKVSSHWEDVKLACPVSKSHRVQPWNDPGRCPRCGNYMEKNGFPYRVWE